MAITYPLSVANFWTLLRVKSVIFAPSYGQQTTGQASGTILYKDLRPQLWSADVKTVPMKFDELNDVQAVLESLDGGMNSFYLYNPLRMYPRTGQFVDTSVQINSLGSDGKSLSLKGLPAGRTVSRGDMISFAYGSRPDYALHRVWETVVANGSGVTAEFAVGAVRPGAAVNAAVKMNLAFGEFKIQGAWKPVEDDQMTQHFEFSVQQA